MGQTAHIQKEMGVLNPARPFLFVLLINLAYCTFALALRSYFNIALLP